MQIRSYFHPVLLLHWYYKPPIQMVYQWNCTYSVQYTVNLWALAAEAPLRHEYGFHLSWILLWLGCSLLSIRWRNQRIYWQVPFQYVQRCRILILCFCHLLSVESALEFLLYIYLNLDWILWMIFHLIDKRSHLLFLYLLSRFSYLKYAQIYFLRHRKGSWNLYWRLNYSWISLFQHQSLIPLMSCLQASHFN